MTDTHSTAGSPPPEDAPTQDAASPTQPSETGEKVDPAALVKAQLQKKESEYLYLLAEFENFKKRSARDAQDLRKFAWEGVARELLGILDNLERAVAHTPAGTDANLVLGLKMVVEQFHTTLQRNGVQTVEALKKAFDPHFHEGVGSEPSELPQGTVIREDLRGYTSMGGS